MSGWPASGPLGCWPLAAGVIAAVWLFAVWLGPCLDWLRNGWCLGRRACLLPPPKRRHTSSLLTQLPGAVSHSGDQLDYAQHSGLHTITIDLRGLGERVAQLVITMSSWGGARLCDIEQPFVQVRRLLGAA